MSRQFRLFFGIFVVFLMPPAVPTKVLAGGYMIPHQSARGLGLSNAMTAGVNDASAVYYNPAALSEIQGHNLLVSRTTLIWITA